MEEHHDDSSHYEVSLTATQALVAFVLLLFSLASSFAFGVIVGKGRSDERLVVQREPAVISEAGAVQPGSKDRGSRIVELGVKETDPSAPVTESLPPATENAPPSTIIDEAPPASASSTAAPDADAPFYAQLLSTSDAKNAENLAAQLIERGFTSAFVDKAASPQGTVYRVRVKYPNEAAARAAADQLKAYATGEVWVTSK